MLDQRLEIQMKQMQRLIMTPRMQQSIHLLQLPTLELNTLVQKELVENPLLEEQTTIEASGTDDHPSKEKESDIQEAVEARTEEIHRGEFDEEWVSYFDDTSDIGYVPASTYEASEDYETPVVRATTLEEHLTWQLNASLDITTVKQREIGETIIHNLNEDGYLLTPLEAIAEQTDAMPEEVEKVLQVIQGFDPVGIGARNLSECLEIQWHYYEKASELGLLLIREYLEDLEHKRYAKIARATGISEKRVQELADEIGTLEPRPGRSYREVEAEYITPDVFVERVDGEWEVRLNDEGTPPLRISKKYRRLLDNPNGITEQEREFILNKYKSAVWLIRNIEQRKRTLYNVTRCIVDLQKDFLEKGISAMKPMRLRDVADIVGVHEATVCRVVNHKYVQTPQGLFELKFFFSTGLDTDDGQDASVKAVMDRIRQIVDEENPRKPLSDIKISERLNADGIRIARRTVAKYRERMGILPTSTRKRV